MPGSGVIESYITFLRERMAFTQVGDWMEIKTPYLDRHNDVIYVYLKREDDGSTTITDGGDTISDLENSGCPLDTPTRQKFFTQVINRFGVEMLGDQLVTHAKVDTQLGLKKHNLVQAMLGIGDLFCLSKATVKTVFHEDVATWLKVKKIINISNVKLPGKGGYDHYFDFVVPQSDGKPERILKLLSRPTKDRAENVVFAFTDTREIRQGNPRMIAVLNDEAQKPAAGLDELFGAYDVVPFWWSHREERLAELA